MGDSIPHYYEGELTGQVLLDGKECKDLSLFEISEKVGSVFQNPRSQFFNVDTTSEIAFGPENHGLPEQDIRNRVQQVAEQLNLNGLLDRSIFSLSGGEKQKIACGSAAAIQPEGFVFDEPSSNLDAYAIEDLRKLLKVLKAEGKTVIIAEHRLYYLYDLADRVLYLKDGEIAGDYSGREFSELAESQREAMGLRPLTLSSLRQVTHEKRTAAGPSWRMKDFHFSYRDSKEETLCLDNTELSPGRVTAVIGHNGAGKTTFSRCLCGLEKRCSGSLQQEAKQYGRKQRLKLCYNAVIPSVLLSVLPGGMALWLSGSLETMTFMAAIIFSLGLVGPIMEAFSFTGSLAMLGKNTEEIDSILNAEELHHANKPVALDDLEIELKNVAFSYDKQQEVLHGINLSIHPGTMTALVGPSGSGKSTVAKLIAGYWDVTSGSITLGGHELTEIPLSQLAAQISYVSQDNYLFNRSIRENIRMGKPDASDEEVEQAAIRSGCDSFIHGLDKGYETIVGSSGSQLSGGERQRIAIARAMLKDAPIVILDEATAFIDPENEAIVQKAISALTAGKTLVVIAHRLSTITGADNIVVVNAGNIEAQGTHEQLLAHCPLYKDMWQAHIGARDEA